MVPILATEAARRVLDNKRGLMQTLLLVSGHRLANAKSNITIAH